MIELAAVAAASGVAGYLADTYRFWPQRPPMPAKRKPARKGKGSVVVKHTAPKPLNTMAPKRAKPKPKRKPAKRKG